MPRLIFTNNTRLNNTNYISGSGVGAVSSSNRRALTRRAAPPVPPVPPVVPAVVDKLFAYVANRGSSSVSAFNIDTTTGALTKIQEVTAGIFPVSVTVDPTGKFAYVANQTSGTVSAYTINQTTGELTKIIQPNTDASGNIIVGNTSNSVAVDPTGNFAYVTNGNSTSVSAFTINQTTGALDKIIGTDANGNFFTGSNPNSVTIHPIKKFAYVTNSGGTGSVSAFTIRQTGALTKITQPGGDVNGNVATGTSPSSVTIEPNGKFAYISNRVGDSVSAYTINQDTGVLTRIIQPGGDADASGNVLSGDVSNFVTVDPTGKFAYVAYSSSPGAVSAFTINQTSGALTKIIPDVIAGGSPFSVTVEPTGNFAYVANFGGGSVSAFTINKITGELTKIIQPGGTVSAVPSANGNILSGANPISVITVRIK